MGNINLENVLSIGLLASGCLFLVPMLWQGKHVDNTKDPFLNNISSKDRLHLPISPPTPPQPSCHAVLSDTPAGAYNSSMFREYFLITFCQVLVAVLSGALWVPYLSTFPSTLILSTIATFLLSFVITKLGPIRYKKPKCKGLVSFSNISLISFTDIFLAYLPQETP